MRDHIAEEEEANYGACKEHRKQFGLQCLDVDDPLWECEQMPCYEGCLFNKEEKNKKKFIQKYLSDYLELNGEYRLYIDEEGFLKLLECGSTEEIEEGNLQEYDFPFRIKDIELFR